MYQKFWTDKEKVDKVVATVNEYLAILIERSDTLRTTANLTEAEHDLFRVEAKKADRVSRIIEDFTTSLNYGDTEQSENEQLESVKTWMKEVLIKQGGYNNIDKDLVKSLKGYFRTILDQKEKAYGVYATLADDMRVKLLAVQFLLEQATHAATHRSKNARIDAITETITTIVENLGRIDKDHPEQYYWNIRSNVGSWSYVQALRDMHYQKVELDNLRKENEELKASLGQYETKEEFLKEHSELLDDSIPF